MKQKAQLTQQDKAKFISGIVAVAIVLLLYFFGCNNSKTITKPSKEGAYILSQEFVKRTLKAPATAEFGPINEAEITQVNDKEFTVKSYVDAQNGFGALIRSDYSVKIIYNSDTTAIPQDLKIDNL